MTENGWSEARMYVTKELDRLGDEMARMNLLIGEVKADLRALKLGDSRHAMIFGLLGGAIMSFIGGIVLAVVLK